MGPLVDEGESVLIGSGDGTLAGPVLSGVLRWTLFEQPDELVCAMSPALEIVARDEAEIRVEGDFDSQGHRARYRANLQPKRA
jgi:hypothetical protein